MEPMERYQIDYMISRTTKEFIIIKTIEIECFPRDIQKRAQEGLGSYSGYMITFLQDEEL